MIINFYIRENEVNLIETLKSISEREKRSFSFIIREALEHYLRTSLAAKGRKSKSARRKLA